MAEEKKNDEIFWTCRLMEQKDIDGCLKLWFEAGFNEDRKTCIAALEATPGGLYVAEKDGTGEIIGTCSANMVKPDTAFVGYYVVKKEYHGRGIGKSLWTRSYDKMYPSMNIGLCAVPYMADKYRGCGMRQEDPYPIVIYGLDASPAATEKIQSLQGADQLESGCRLVQINSAADEDLFKQLCVYNEQVQKFSREDWLRCMLSGDDIPLTLAVVETVKDNSKDQEISKIVGFGCIRRDNFEGGSIGPVHADNPKLAEIILKSLLEKFKIEEGKPYTAIISKRNIEELSLEQKLGFKFIDEYPKLFSRFVPKSDSSKIFVVQSAGFTLF